MIWFVTWDNRNNKQTQLKETLYKEDHIKQLENCNSVSDTINRESQPDDIQDLSVHKYRSDLSVHLLRLEELLKDQDL